MDDEREYIGARQGKLRREKFQFDSRSLDHMYG